MNKKLLQEINRIHEITYGIKGVLSEDAVSTDIVKKGFAIKNDLSDFYNTLQTAINKGGIKKQNKGEGFYQKSVESLQVGLILLGYALPKYGVDGIYGTETAQAVKEFNKNNNISGFLPKFLQKFKDILGLEGQDQESSEDASPETIEKLIYLLKSKNVTSDDLKRYVSSPSQTQFSIPGDIGGDDEFYKAILNCFGAPSSSENMKFLYAWRQAEGGHAKNNPFNTTWKLKTSTRYGQNKSGVQNYETKQDGINATCKTLNNQRYRCIVNGLRNDIGSKRISIDCNSALATWGTHYSRPIITQILSSYERGITPKPKKIQS